MKRALIVLLALTLAACGQVRPGHVGIKVNQFGSGAGVENQSLGVGTYFTPFGTTIIEYPVYTQTYTYSQNSQEGSSNNEEFTFQDKNGLNIESDIAVSYSVNPELAPKLYSKFRVDAAGTLEPIESGPVPGFTCSWRNRMVHAKLLPGEPADWLLQLQAPLGRMPSSARTSDAARRLPGFALLRELADVAWLGSRQPGEAGGGLGGGAGGVCRAAAAAGQRRGAEQR